MFHQIRDLGNIGTRLSRLPRTQLVVVRGSTTPARLQYYTIKAENWLLVNFLA